MLCVENFNLYAYLLNSPHQNLVRFIFVYQESLNRPLNTGFWVNFWMYVRELWIHKGYFVVKSWCEIFVLKRSGIQICFNLFIFCKILIIIWIKFYFRFSYILKDNHSCLLNLFSMFNTYMFSYFLKRYIFLYNLVKLFNILFRFLNTQYLYK